MENMDKIEAVYNEGIGVQVKIYGAIWGIEDYLVASLNGGPKKKCLIYTNITEPEGVYYFDIDGVTVPIDECIRL